MTHKPYIITTRDLLNQEQMIEWIRGAYWGEWMTDSQVAKSLKNSTLFGLFLRTPELEQIGFASMISDHAAVTAITGVYVDEKYRGQGYGRFLMDKVCGHNSVARCITVLSTRVPEFYAKFGFAEHGRNGQVVWMQREANR